MTTLAKRLRLCADDRDRDRDRPDFLSGRRLTTRSQSDVTTVNIPKARTGLGFVFSLTPAATVGASQTNGVTTTALGWVYDIGVAAVIGLGLMYAFARETFEDLMGRFARIAVAVGLAFGAATVASALGLGAAAGATLR